MAGISLEIARNLACDNTRFAIAPRGQERGRKRLKDVFHEAPSAISRACCSSSQIDASSRRASARHRSPLVQAAAAVHQKRLSAGRPCEASLADSTAEAKWAECLYRSQHFPLHSSACSHVPVIRDETRCVRHDVASIGSPLNLVMCTRRGNPVVNRIPAVTTASRRTLNGSGPRPAEAGA